MSGFHPQRYGPVVAALLEGAPLNELGPGVPNEAAYARLSALTPEKLVGGAMLCDRQMALACLAGLWLRHDYQDRSHHISQDLDTREGSYWHAILHRREPDFANARYWFRRVGAHPIEGPLLEAARRLVSASKPQPAAAFLLSVPAWDAGRFVGLCEEAIDGTPPLHTLVKKIQAVEWELLFDHCYRSSIGADEEGNTVTR